jgi:hypothetical protein
MTLFFLVCSVEPWWLVFYAQLPKAPSRQRIAVLHLATRTSTESTVRRYAPYLQLMQVASQSHLFDFFCLQDLALATRAWKSNDTNPRRLELSKSLGSLTMIPWMIFSVSWKGLLPTASRCLCDSVVIIIVKILQAKRHQHHRHLHFNPLDKPAHLEALLNPQNRLSHRIVPPYESLDAP